MKPIINGNIGPILVSKRLSYSPSRGISETTEYESAGDNLGGIATECIESGVQYEMLQNGRRSRLSFTKEPVVGGDAATEITTDRWELLANEVSFNIRSHPRVRAMAATGPESVASAEGYYQTYLEDKTTPPADHAIWTATTSEGYLFRLLVNGASAYYSGQYVLRHTTNVSNAYDTNVADLGVEFIYTTAQLISEISSSQYWLQPCPGRLRAKIERIENQGSGAAGFMWGWRKLPSTETTAANNRIDISTEYQLGDWSTFLYSPA